MRKLCSRLSRFAFALVLICAAGCSKSSPPAPLALDQFGAVFGQAFGKANPDVKDLANEIIACVKSNSYAKAYSGLQTLSAVPGLSQEQSSVIGRGMLTVNGLLQEASTKGDESATAAMKVYKSNK